MIATIMKACQEYSSFVIDPANRDVSESHVERLAEAVDETYLLDAYPIVATPERVIVDGQHRFKMAKSMNLPFYYIAGDGVSIEDVALANANTERYTFTDALHVYAAMEMASYEFLLEFCKAHPHIVPSSLGKWLSSTYDTADFMNGLYVVDRREYAAILARWTFDLSQYQAHIPTSSAYKRALETLYRTPGYDHGRMMSKVDQHPRRLVRCGTTDEAMAVLDELYNFKARINKTSLIDAKLNPLESTIDAILPISGNPEKPRRGMVNSQNRQVGMTDDLSKFVVHSSARPLRNVSKLAKAIERRNLLQFYPIIVDKDFVVYDGQRRLEAAKLLGLPIYYITLQNVSMWMIAQAGGIAKGWGYNDYLKHYVAECHPEYIRVKHLISKHPFLTIQSFFCIPGQSYLVQTSLFKSGTYAVAQSIMDEFIGFLGNINDAAIAKSLLFQKTIARLYRENPSRAFLDRMQKVINGMDGEELRSPDLETLLVKAYNKSVARNQRIEEVTAYAPHGVNRIAS